MSTVKLYFRTAKDVVLSNSYSLNAPRLYDETREDWDDGVFYVLPEGYTVGEDSYGELAIWDGADQICQTDIHGSSGRPQLSSAGTTSRPVLRRAEVRRFRIVHTKTGTDLGTYEAVDARSALLALDDDLSIEPEPARAAVAEA